MRNISYLCNICLSLVSYSYMVGRGIAKKKSDGGIGNGRATNFIGESQRRLRDVFDDDFEMDEIGSNTHSPTHGNPNDDPIQTTSNIGNL